MDDFRLYLFTADPRLAAAAQRAGVDFIGPDLELLGKHERQGGMNTWVSNHSADDLAPVYRQLSPERRFVRCNPPHPGLDEELERLLRAGAQAVMLPYFHAVDEAAGFARAIGDRARAILLVETRDSAMCIGALARLPGIDAIHVGLNDLRLDCGYATHFELMCSEWLADLCARVTQAGMPLGVGGIGRAMDERLPIPADLVYAQYPRLGARAALVSRVFTQGIEADALPGAVAAARARLAHWFAQPAASLEAARQALLATGRRAPSR